MTLDTKGAEVDYLRRATRAEGSQPMVIATAILDRLLYHCKVVNFKDHASDSVRLGESDTLSTIHR